MRLALRAARLTSRYTSSELASAFRLRMLRSVDRFLTQRLRTTHRSVGRLPIAKPVALSAVRAIAELVGDRRKEAPEVLRIQHAAQVDLCSSALNGYPIIWSDCIRRAYSRGPWNWHPYVVATRLTNWLLCAACQPAMAGVHYSHELAPALVHHVRFLSRRLERHLGGNHLLRQLVAIMLGSGAVGLDDEDETRDVANAYLAMELERQFIGGAVHFENSPMYHAHAALDLAIAYPYLVEYDHAWEERLAPVLRSAADALAAMCRPDGSYPRFGDSTEGLVPPVRLVLETIVAALEVDGCTPLEGLLPGGLFFRRWGENWLGFRAWARPPRTCPGHWHDDLLSVELFVAGRALLSNAGVYSYDADAKRAFSRSVVSHSAPDPGIPQAEKWGAFRVGSVVPSSGGSSEDQYGCWGSYTLPPPLGHTITRAVRIDPHYGRIEITDRAMGPREMVVRFLLAPRVRPQIETGQVSLKADDADLAKMSWSGASLAAVGAVPYFPRIGEETTTQCLAFQVQHEARWMLQCAS